MHELYDAPAVCDNCGPMKPQVLVTKRVYPEAIEFLERHAEVEYVNSDDGAHAPKSWPGVSAASREW